MFLFDLDNLSLSILVGAFSFLGISIYLHHNNKEFVTKFLFLGSFFLGVFYAGLDPFLNLWDEQFHALVAKNLVNDFFTPKLYNNPSLPLDYKCWTNNEIWLHKQPLFLWQMAISIKLFGPTVFAVRLPSVIMHALTSLLVYEIGAVVWNKKTALYGAILFTVASYPLELIAGNYSTDHNDSAFLFYTTASFWAWFNYEKESKWYWLLLIGIFSGFAVLNKWLLGLIIFFAWGIVKLTTNRNQLFTLKSYLPILLAATISTVIFMPWQIYSFIEFPNEATHEFSYNSKHLFEAIEGHSGKWYFHFIKGFKKLYADSFVILLLVVIAILFSIAKIKNLRYKIFLISLIGFVYTFFSLVATKMISYPLLIFPIICLTIGHLIINSSELLRLKKNKSLLPISILIIVCSVFFNFEALNQHHIKNRKEDSKRLIGKFSELKMIETLDYYLLNENYILFNSSITPYGHIPVLFFTDYEAYSHIPSESQLNKLRTKGCKIACLNNGKLPEYILNDKTIRLVPIPKIMQ